MNGRTSCPGRLFFSANFWRRGRQTFELPNLPAKALVHGHCHHKSLMKMTDEESVLEQDGDRLERPGAGLLRHGRIVRLRRRQVRRVDGDRRIGTSAGGAPGSGRQPDHRRRLQLPRTDRPIHRPPCACTWRRSSPWLCRGQSTPDESYPEKPQVDRRQADLERSMKRAGLGIAAIAAGAALLWWLNRK